MRKKTDVEVSEGLTTTVTILVVEATLGSPPSLLPVEAQFATVEPPPVRQTCPVQTDVVFVARLELDHGH